MHETSLEVSHRYTVRWRRLIAAEALLIGALGVGAIVAGYVNWQQAGQAALAAAGMALLACWFPNAISLVLMGLLRQPRASVFVMLFSMLTRVAWPFLLVFGLLQSKHWSIDAGVLPMVVVLYLIGLSVETAMSLWIIRENSSPAVKAS